jgi:hypothetical protein
MKRTLAVLSMTVLACMAAPARAQDEAAPPAAPAEGDLVPGEAEGRLDVPVVPVETAPQLPRRLRWEKMEVAYLRANVCHPIVYWRSAAESPRYDDAAARGCLGQAGVWLCEVASFALQAALTPIEWLCRPPWTTECTRP